MELIKSKKILSFIRKQNASPLFNAKGIAVGVFSGCFPFFGFQTFLGIFLAKIVKGNLLLAAFGTWISNPFTYVPLYVFNYKVGSIFLKNSSEIIIEPKLLREDLWSQGWFITSRLIFGSSIVGIISGLTCGFITFMTYKKIKKIKVK